MTMVNGRVIRLFLAGGMLAFALSAWAQQGQGIGMRGSPDAGGCQSLIASLPKQDLSATEAVGLNYLREEEKLARDVYTELYVKWGLRIFGNIAQSEQRHFDALKVLLDRYELDDPAADNTVGVFTDPGLRTLYEGLVAQAQASPAAALRAGATIEDLDIRDLDQALAVIDNDDLRTVYQNLQRGSRNHIRAFVGQLEALGETYEPQYISAAALTEILTNPREAGMGCGRGGNGLGRAGRWNGACPLGNVPPAGSSLGSRRP